MNSKSFFKYLSMLLAIVLCANMLPTAAIAEALEEQQELATASTESSIQSNAPATNAGQEPTAQEGTPTEQPASSSFEQTQTVDDSSVTVKAPAGTFPEGAKLQVEKVPAQDQAKVDEAVGAKRESAPDAEAQANAAVSYTYDIKVLDAEGKELQPAKGKKVEVSFAMPQVADANLTTSVYHVEKQEGTDALTAQKLETTENEAEKKVTAESDGFSCYTVEFTYGRLQYVLTGDGSVPLADILRAVGLTGEPQVASTSNPELFSTSNETGQWVVTARKAFSSQEWMKVTIANVEYQIVVTDAQGGESTENDGDSTPAVSPKSLAATSERTPEKTTVSGKKTWDDNNDQNGKRPDSITIRLLANGVEQQTKTVTAADNWSWTFANLDADKDGEEITYAITEDAVANYTTEVDNYNVTNTYDPGKTSLSVHKVWDDNNDQDGRRPSEVIVHLLANGKTTNKILILSDLDDWTDSFTDLDAKVDGKDVAYTVQEEDVDGYTSSVSGDATKGFTVTSRYQPETTSVSVRKVWDDGTQSVVQHSPVVVRLYANGQEIESKTLTSENSWTWTREDLPKYKGGHEISYTVSEDATHDYTTAASGNAKDGFVITNTNAPGKTSLSVRKVWDDRYNQDGKRPDSITVRLLANDKDTGKSLVLNEGNGWSGIFDEIIDDPAIAYTVAEDRDGDWAKLYDEDPEITGDATTGYTIVNEYEPESVSIDGTKVWSDNGNAAGKRPETITVRLFANGIEFDRGTIDRNSLGNTSENEWKWNFAAKDKYENGHEIAYTVTEDAVPDYATTYDKGEKSDEGYKNYTVTNRYGEDTVGKTQVTVHQVWIDSNDKDGLRPKTTEVFLLANGEPTGRSITLGRAEGLTATAAGGDDREWFGVFEGLDAKDTDGNTIKYSVTKDPVPAYDTYYSGNAKRGFTIVDEYKGEGQDTPPAPSDPSDNSSSISTDNSTGSPANNSSGSSTMTSSTRTSGTSTPKTGDENNPSLWLLMTAAALGMVAIGLRRRRTM